MKQDFQRRGLIEGFPPPITLIKEVGILHSLVLLLHVIANINYLQDVMVGTELQCPNVDLNIVLQEVLSQLANFLRPGGAPHQGLTIWLLGQKGCGLKVFIG